MKHFLFLSWPDYGVPPDANGFLKFLFHVRKAQHEFTKDIEWKVRTNLFSVFIKRCVVKYSAQGWVACSQYYQCVVQLSVYPCNSQALSLFLLVVWISIYSILQSAFQSILSSSQDLSLFQVVVRILVYSMQQSEYQDIHYSSQDLSLFHVVVNGYMKSCYHCTSTQWLNIEIGCNISMDKGLAVS